MRFREKWKFLNTLDCFIVRLGMRRVLRLDTFNLGGFECAKVQMWERKKLEIAEPF
jgi:hypothetical protein